MAEGPSPVQLAVLREIFAALEKRGFPPTIRELCDTFGFASTNAISTHMRALIKKGLIERAAQTARGLRITQLGRDYVTGRAA